MEVYRQLATCRSMSSWWQVCMGNFKKLCVVAYVKNAYILPKKVEHLQEV